MSQTESASKVEQCDSVHGINPQAAIAAIKDRARRWQAGDRTPDGRKLGLVIEGGAMRAVCSGGGAVALAHMGFTEIFDEVYATSAGVMNASYFLSDQATLGIRVYYEDLCDWKFINPFRLWKILDVDYVFNRVVTVNKPLNVEHVLQARTKFYVAVIDKEAAEGRVVHTQASGTPFLNVLKAATAMPVLYNRSVEVDGRACMDGGIAISFPLEQALANGCTDVLVLLTRPFKHESKPAGLFSRTMFKLLCSRGNRKLNELYLRRPEWVRRARNLALGKTAPPTGVNIATICTDDPHMIQRTTHDPAILRAAAVSYGKKTLRVFGEDPDAWDLAPLP